MEQLFRIHYSDGHVNSRSSLGDTPPEGTGPAAFKLGMPVPLQHRKTQVSCYYRILYCTISSFNPYCDIPVIQRPSVLVQRGSVNEAVVSMNQTLVEQAETPREALESLLWNIEETSWELLSDEVKRILMEFGVRAVHSMKGPSRGVIRCRLGGKLYRRPSYTGVRTKASLKMNCPFRINGNANLVIRV